MDPLTRKVASRVDASLQWKLVPQTDTWGTYAVSTDGRFEIEFKHQVALRGAKGRRVYTLVDHKTGKKYERRDWQEVSDLKAVADRLLRSV